jgi:hypothetical protein
VHRRGGGKCEGFWFPHMESVAAEDVVSPTQRVNPTFLFLPFPPVKKGVGGLVVLFGLSSPLGFILLSSLSLPPFCLFKKTLYLCVAACGERLPLLLRLPVLDSRTFFLLFLFSSLSCLSSLCVASAVSNRFCS